MKFVGEIGVNRREYLYELNHLDLLQIERGYERRYRHQWSLGRWQTFKLMEAFCGTKALRDSGINAPTDLIRFPWDNGSGDEPAADITKEEIKRLQQDMLDYNARVAAAKQTDGTAEGGDDTGGDTPSGNSGDGDLEP